jgi:hypothetical protein
MGLNFLWHQVFGLAGVYSPVSDQRRCGDPGMSTCVREATRMPDPGYTLRLDEGVYRSLASYLGDTLTGPCLRKNLSRKML